MLVSVIAIVIALVGVVLSGFELWMIKRMLAEHHESIHDLFHEHIKPHHEIPAKRPIQP